MFETNSQIKYIEKEIESVKRKYLSNAIEVISDFNNENKTKNDYKGRQIYELMQNADDCYNDNCQEIKIKFILKDNLLIILNNGTPFDGRGIASLMHPDASSKYGNTIGCKGLGFRSVLNWSSNISIYTENFEIHFSDEIARQQLDYYKEYSDKTHVAELDKIDRVAILSSATLGNNKNDKELYLESGYTTAIVLKCEEKFIDVIQKQLIDLQFEELLFLKHIRFIDIVSPKAKREIVAIKDGESCAIEEGGKKSTYWKVWSKEGDLLQSYGESKKYELAIAYNEDPIIREDLRKNGCLYSYFKTDMPMPLPFLIHGTFNLSSERNKLVKDDENNKQLLKMLIDFIVEKSIEITTYAGECDYEALKFAIPFKEVYFLDTEYNFTNNIKDKIKEQKVFPSIKGTYLCLDEKPRYSDNRFDEILNKETFYQLLKHCDDEKIVSFIKECGIKFYSHEEFCKLAVINADEYIKNETNIEIVKLYLDEYQYSALYGPYILTDSEGNRIADKNTKIFNNPVNTFDLPHWSKMRFINKSLEDKISEAIGVQRGRELVNRLSIFNMEEYSFDKVVNELNKQCDTPEKVKDLLKWLYENWIKNNQTFQSSLTTVDLKVVTRDGTIDSCSNCYFGIEYGNAIGEKLIKSCGIDSSFVADKTNIGFENIDDRTFVEFLKYIGIKKYPRIENIRLDSETNKDYFEYNAKLNPIICTDRGEEKKNEDFLSRSNIASIKVDSIIGIENILINCDFEEIIYWILNDSDLFQHITSEYELNEKSSIVGYAKGSISPRTIRKSYMRSWLRKVFVETPWLNTKSGIKTNCLNIMFADYNLSPIVETLNVNYERLKDLFGKRVKSEVDAVFEKLGVVETFADLSKIKIYESLKQIPDIDNSDYSIGKNIYTQLNQRFNAEDVDELISNNPAYDAFMADGKVLAKQNGKPAYMPHNEVYYVENKIYSNEILDRFPTLVLGKRAGKNKINKMFGVKPIDEFINAKVIDRVEHPCNKAFQEYYLKLLPYIYSKRIGKDNKNNDLNKLRKTKIFLVSDAKVEYSSESTNLEGKLTDYELIYTDENAFIKVPTVIRTLDELKQTMDFRMAFAEIITTIFKVESDKEAYINMLSCKDNGELEKYLRDEDENLVSLNKSKELFGAQIDYKDEFWKTISVCSGKAELDLKDNYSSLLGENFDYAKPDEEIIIELFKALNIDLNAYNESAFRTIHLEDYYHTLFVDLKTKYREHYLTKRALEIFANDGLKKDYDAIVQEYDFKEYQFENSVNVNVLEIYENVFEVSIKELESITDKLCDIVPNLKNEDTAVNTEQEYENDQKNVENDEEIIDFVSLNNEIAENTDDTVLDAVTEKPVTSERNNKLKKPGVPKSYNSNNTKKKELNGFIAESKVYNTLLKIVSDKGSIVWASGNGEKAKKCDAGDDSLGYDIKYTVGGKIHYAEVKGTSGKVVEFTLTKNEYEFGDAHKDTFELWFVFIEDDGIAGDPILLGNIFKFDENESFFNNSKFSVEQSEFKIKARLKI